MPQINTLGPVGFNPIGEYDNTKQYERLDVVLYQNTSYVALKDSKGQTPTNTEYWDCLGISGVDISNYYTKTETNTLLNGKQDTIDSTHKLSTSLIDGLATVATSGSYNDLSNTPDLSVYEVSSNKVASISSSSTDTQYPSAKCVYDLIGDINTALDTINGEVI